MSYQTLHVKQPYVLSRVRPETKPLVLGVKKEVKLFRINCPPTPPLSQH